jgi:hypothetical protein
MDQGAGASETRAAGRAALRLCNLVAQSPGDAKGGLQAGGGAGTDGKGRGTVGADLLQSLQDPDSRVEQAIETAAQMLGTDKSRGYCLEMICADFLAGASLGDPNPETLLYSMTRLFKFLRGEQQQASSKTCEGVMRMIRATPTAYGLDPSSYESLRQQILRRDGWTCQS